MKKIFFRILFFSLFFICGQVKAAPVDIIINEIGAYETSEYEWVEIYNKGSEPVDITGWKFWENGTNHGLTATGTSDSIVAPGEYAIIAQDAGKFLTKYPNLQGSVFDSAWSSLREDGEEIGLKDTGGNFIEKFIYLPAPNFSLERKDFNLADYTAVNWQEHASGNTVGMANSGGVTPSPPPEVGGGTTTTTPVSPPPASPAGGSQGEDSLPLPPPAPSPAPPVYDLVSWANIRLNEIAPYPSAGNEWVEIYNTGQSPLDLSGGLICDERNTTSTCKETSGMIFAGGFAIIETGTRFLNNDGDTVILKNPLGYVLDSAVYGEDYLEVPKQGQSLARLLNGTGAWAIEEAPTRATANSFKTGFTEDVILPVYQTTAPKTEAGNIVVSTTPIRLAPVVAPIKNIVKKRTTTKSKVTTVIASEINRIRDLPKGSPVRVRGTVIVLPGIFGSQYFYITDGWSGIQIFQYKKDFPELAVGDLVEVSGAVSEANGIKRINFKTSRDVDILSTENAVSSTPYNIEELGEDNLGSLARVRGEITEIKTNYMYVDDGEAEIKVYFKKGASIDKSKFKEGDLAEVIGVLEKSAEELQIWPRSDNDIVYIGPSEDILAKQARLQKTNGGGIKKYLTTTVGGIGALILGFVARARAIFLKDAVKKGVALVAGIFKRNV